MADFIDPNELRTGKCLASPPCKNQCQEAAPTGQRLDNWPYCACGHTINVHQVVELAPPKKETSDV